MNVTNFDMSRVTIQDIDYIQTRLRILLETYKTSFARFERRHKSDHSGTNVWASYCSRICINPLNCITVDIVFCEVPVIDTHVTTHSTVCRKNASFEDSEILEGIFKVGTTLGLFERDANTTTWNRKFSLI